jgi:hypothetical protein
MRRPWIRTLRCLLGAGIVCAVFAGLLFASGWLQALAGVVLVATVAGLLDGLRRAGRERP